jgi:hypothetical protein
LQAPEGQLNRGSKIGGQLIIALPERRQQLLKIEFSRDESAFYKQVCIDAAWLTVAGL